MKKMITLLLVGLLVGSLLPGAASAGKGKKKKKPKPQVEEGSIALPAPWIDDSGCYAGLYRRISILSGESDPHKGTIGYSFDVDKKTWNKPFFLEGDGNGDLDIYFYTELGTPEDVITDPGAAGNPPSVSFNDRNTDGEYGKVPPEMNKVIICMMTEGSETSFTYTAGKGIKLPDWAQE